MNLNKLKFKIDIIKSTCEDMEKHGDLKTFDELGEIQFELDDLKPIVEAYHGALIIAPLAAKKSEP